VLYNGEALEVMDKLIAEGVVVDAIITDPPYGTTACKWDSVIDFEEMWERLNKLIKPNGAIVLFGSEPFSSALRMSNIKNYKYDWVWDKKAFSNQMMAKKQPLRIIENVIVFNSKIYHPQGLIEINKVTKQGSKITDNIGGGKRKTSYIQTHTNYPRNILEFSKDRPSTHPTQKPVALMEYLIKTYTNEGDTVLDFTMGSGSTGVACKNTNRKFIGIEMDKGYFGIAKKRIEGMISVI
jgi:DNA modification methylase